MASEDKFPVPSREVPNGTSKPDHMCNESNGHLRSGVTLLEEDPFGSESSKVLFDGVDKLRRCGASVNIDLGLPQVSHSTEDHDITKFMSGIARNCWTTIRREIVSTPKPDRYPIPSW